MAGDGVGRQRGASRCGVVVKELQVQDCETPQASTAVS